MNTWQFETAPLPDGTATWRWVCLLPDGTRRTCDRLFDEFRQCEEDAEAHGYLKRTLM